MSAYHDLPHNITCIDSGLVRPNMAAFYMMRSGDDVAFIETGTQHSVDTALEVLEQKGIPLENVRYVIPTHVHLDHAGGAGKLMALAPNAELLVHPRGARHMIDPSKLWAGATAVYGEDEMQRLYGEALTIDEDRVRIMEDGDEVELNGRKLMFRDTPGHAKHHFCVWDEKSKGWFTGDTFGISYREFDHNNEVFIFPTTTPVQFDPDALLDSLEKLIRTKPERMYLTHFGMVERPNKLMHQLRIQILHYQHVATTLRDSENRVEAIKAELTDYTLQRLTDWGSPLSRDEAIEILDMDMMLNAQGLDVWLERLASA